MVALKKELPNKNDFEAVLASFCCYEYDVIVSEAVQKIPTDQKDYHKCSSCVSLLNSQNISINNNEKNLIPRAPPT